MVGGLVYRERLVLGTMYTEPLPGVEGVILRHWPWCTVYDFLRIVVR